MMQAKVLWVVMPCSVGEWYCEG